MISSRIQYHPLANLFPLIEGEEFAALVEDIKQHGLRESITLHEGKILDGRNRYRACLAANVKCRFETYGGNDPLGYVISRNLRRRHLNESQRAMVAARLATMKQGTRTDISPVGEMSQPRAAALLNVGKRSVERAAKVRERGDPDLIRAVETGKVKVSAAADIAALSKEDQRAILATGKAIRAVTAAENRAKWMARTAALSNANAPLPCDRRYPIILADPPWEFKVYSALTGSERCPETHYPTMSTEAICGLPIADIATADAALFLWTTSHHIQESFSALEAWGFRYVTNIVWVKDKIGLGYWIRNQHELLFIAARGDMRRPPNVPASVIYAPRREHSRKPDEAYDLIERMYPDLPKIELFARGGRKGWAVWGNQAEAA